jgi:uncharacterized protein YceH (UPF0502 family)
MGRSVERVETMSGSALPVLSPVEARVLGVLVEKQLTTPDYYPLTLNALVAGCNQKSSRNPVMQVNEPEVQMALDALKRQTLVIDSYGASGRVMRYAHNLPKVLNVGQQITALLAVLMLRGPQTPGELRTASERMYSFADISSVEAFLEEMAMRPTGALVAKLPRQPGSREPRWAQLLSVPDETQADHAAVGQENHAPVGQRSAAPSELAEMKASLEELRGEVAQLRGLVEQLRQELDLKRTDS